MKTRIYSPLNILTVALALATFILPAMAKAAGPVTAKGVTFYLNISAGAVCGPAANDTTDGSLLVWESPDRGCAAILGTDGEQMTLDEFRAINGTARVQCVESGTLVNVHLTGLQPRGVYTVWVPTTAGNIFPPPLAATALGSTVESVAAGDPIVNDFTASASGEGQITRIQPAGTGTFVAGTLPGCLLDAAAFEIHIAYHQNGQTNGGIPGPPATWAIPERFIFSNQ